MGPQEHGASGGGLLSRPELLIHGAIYLVVAILRATHEALAARGDALDHSSLRELLQQIRLQTGVSQGALMHTLRSALTGMTVSSTHLCTTLHISNPATFTGWTIDHRHHPFA